MKASAVERLEDLVRDGHRSDPRYSDRRNRASTRRWSTAPCSPGMPSASLAGPLLLHRRLHRRGDGAALRRGGRLAGAPRLRRLGEGGAPSSTAACRGAARRDRTSRSGQKIARGLDSVWTRISWMKPQREGSRDARHRGAALTMEGTAMPSATTTSVSIGLTIGFSCVLAAPLPAPARAADHNHRRGQLDLRQHPGERGGPLRPLWLPQRRSLPGNDHTGGEKVVAGPHLRLGADTASSTPTALSRAGGPWRRALLRSCAKSRASRPSSAARGGGEALRAAGSTRGAVRADGPRKVKVDFIGFAPGRFGQMIDANRELDCEHARRPRRQGLRRRPRRCFLQ